jgi:O-acetyl-ADP-ribose deacetylase (regulator of RNase III)
LEWIDTALKTLARDWEALGITALALPMIGCGKGELKWDAVRPLVYKHLDPISLEVSIFLK